MHPSWRGPHSVCGDGIHGHTQRETLAWIRLIPGRWDGQPAALARDAAR